MERYNQFSYTTVQDSTAPETTSAAYSIYTTCCRAEECLRAKDYGGAVRHADEGLNSVTCHGDTPEETEDVERFRSFLQEISFMAGLDKINAAIDAIGGESNSSLTESERQQIEELARERSTLIAVEQWRQDQKAHLAQLDEERWRREEPDSEDSINFSELLVDRRLVFDELEWEQEAKAKAEKRRPDENQSAKPVSEASLSEESLSDESLSEGSLSGETLRGEPLSGTSLREESSSEEETCCLWIPIRIKLRARRKPQPK